MNEVNEQCLDAFPKWLASLAEDANGLASLLSAESIPEAARRYVAGSINYLYKSLDLIPDGIEDLGFLDDAFVLRVAARLALKEAPEAKEADIRGMLTRFAAEAELIEKLLEGDYARLETYVRNLKKSAARGRTVDEIVTDPTVRAEFVHEVGAWAKSYATPSFTRDERTIIKLKSFLGSKLP
ncbi:MAG: DUF1232 domain-containing protein [Deltaproteobacteria bacterium]|nr:DUF1232 domain-containing protein [Deltaproteobacteria bacterium]